VAALLLLDHANKLEVREEEQSRNKQVNVISTELDI